MARSVRHIQQFPAQLIQGVRSLGSIAGRTTGTAVLPSVLSAPRQRHDVVSRQALGANLAAVGTNVPVAAEQSSVGQGDGRLFTRLGRTPPQDEDALEGDPRRQAGLSVRAAPEGELEVPEPVCELPEHVVDDGVLPGQPPCRVPSAVDGQQHGRHCGLRRTRKLNS